MGAVRKERAVEARRDGSQTPHGSTNTISSLTAVPDMAKAYDRYFETGHYASRYEDVNRHVWDRVTAALSGSGEAMPRMLDFGCGDGRYALPLLAHTSAHVTAYDISHAALKELSLKAVSAGHDLNRLDVIAGRADAPLAALDGAEPFDVAGLLFGVLGHVPGRRKRVELLSLIKSRLRPGGHVVLSVPSRLRRLRAAQNAMVPSAQHEPGDVVYQRESDGESIDLFYHLFTMDEAYAELHEAGFTDITMTPESILPEVGATWSRIGRGAEAALRKVVPTSLAYGFLLEGRA